MSMPGEESSRYKHFLKEVTEHFECQENPEPVESVGERIKKIRETKGISLEELSNQTGFPVKLLDQIENQTISPQIGTIIKLAKSLKTVFGTLTAQEGEETYSIVRHSERKTVSRSTSQEGHNYTYIPLASNVKTRHMESFIVKLEPEIPNQALSVHEGEEFLFVLDGEMKVQLGEKTEILSPGDTLYYLSNIPHLVTSNRKEPTYILAVIYTAFD